MLECIWIRFWLCCSVIWQFIMYTHFVIIFDDVICWIWMLIWRPVSRSWGDSPSLDPNIGISTLSELSFTVKGIPPLSVSFKNSRISPLGERMPLQRNYCIVNICQPCGLLFLNSRAAPNWKVSQKLCCIARCRHPGDGMGSIFSQYINTSVTRHRENTMDALFLHLPH